MATALAVIPMPAASPMMAPTRLSNYTIEKQFRALAESVDMVFALADSAELVTPDQQAEFEAEFSRALKSARDKPDRVGFLLADLENQVRFAKEEIDRLKERKEWYERTLELAESCVIRAIKTSFQPNAKGRYPELEGNTCTLGLHANPATVEYSDNGEALVPSEYKTLTIRIPATKWEQLLDLLDVDTAGDLVEAVKKAEVSIDKIAVKKALVAGIEVPGAYLEGNTLETRKHRLVRS